MNSGLSETNVGQVEAVFIDGAAAAHMLEPGTAETFWAYADNVFVPYIVSQLKDTKRIDIVWDVYQTNSLQIMTVVFLAVAVFQKVKLEEMWIAFGAGSHFCYIGIHNVVTALGPSTGSALLFHWLW